MSAFLRDEMIKIHSGDSNGLAHRYDLNVKPFHSLFYCLIKVRAIKSTTHMLSLSPSPSVSHKTKSQRVKFNRKWAKQPVETPDQTTPKHREWCHWDMGWVGEPEIIREGIERWSVDGIYNLDTVMMIFPERKATGGTDSQKDHTLLELKHYHVHTHQQTYKWIHLICDLGDLPATRLTPFVLECCYHINNPPPFLCTDK